MENVAHKTQTLLSAHYCANEKQHVLEMSATHGIQASMSRSRCSERRSALLLLREARIFIPILRFYSFLIKLHLMKLLIFWLKAFAQRAGRKESYGEASRQHNFHVYYAIQRETVKVEPEILLLFSNQSLRWRPSLISLLLRDPCTELTLDEEERR